MYVCNLYIVCRARDGSKYKKEHSSLTKVNGQHVDEQHVTAIL